MQYNLVKVIIFLLSIWYIRCEETETTVRPKPDYGITYGSRASIDEYPCYCRIWMQRSNGNTYFCGGTLIEENLILTAAHCFIDAVKIYTCCGSDSCQNVVGRCYHPQGTEGVYIHKDFARATLSGGLFHDIAYIRTRGSFESDVAKKCKLYRPPQGVNTRAHLEGQKLKVIGCGVTETGKRPPRLLQADQVVIPFGLGEMFYNKINYTISSDYNVIFTKYPPLLAISSCDGDSGSGLFTRNQQGELELCGLVSFGMSNCTAGTPSAYTHIPHYMDFITNGANAVGCSEFDQLRRDGLSARAFAYHEAEGNELSQEIWELAEKNVYDENGMSLSETEVEWENNGSKETTTASSEHRENATSPNSNVTEASEDTRNSSDRSNEETTPLSVTELPTEETTPKKRTILEKMWNIGSFVMEAIKYAAESDYD